MFYRSIQDWSDAYSNGTHIAGGDRFPTAWIEPAAAFRREQTAAARAELGIVYGALSRNRLDLFLPTGVPKGLVVFVHGGYWMSLDNSYWSHLARGPLEHGYAVAMPTYTIAPEARISQITKEVGAAIELAANRVPGPVMLSGHSAGGHLVSRMISATSPLSLAVRTRIRNTVSLSGVHDLRPVMRTRMNETLNIDVAEAQAESPVLLEPMDGARLCCWVGANERAEFIRQSDLLANVWTGLGASTSSFAEPERHHFDVIDGLADPSHALVHTLLG